MVSAAPGPAREPLDRRDPTWRQHLTSPSRGTGRRRVAPSAPDLPADVVEVRTWPAQVALVVATRPYPTAVDALRRVGFGVTVLDPAAAAQAPAPLSPKPHGPPKQPGTVDYLLIGSEVLAQDRGRDVIDLLRAAHPAARVLLLADEGVAAGTLLTAIRAGVQEVLDRDDQLALLSRLRDQTARAARSRRRVLAVGAHPDDVELGCAGTLLEHRRQGDRVSILTLSRGAVGGDARDRTAESATAAEAIGAQLLLGDLPDTRIGDGVETIAVIEQVVAALDPTVVYVHSPHDTHQDHRAVHAATRSAARGVPTVLAYQSPSASEDFRPTAFVPIDGAVEDKLDVLARYRSQSARSYLDVETVTATARYWGRRAGPAAAYAEPFEVLRTVR